MTSIVSPAPHAPPERRQMGISAQVMAETAAAQLRVYVGICGDLASMHEQMAALVAMVQGQGETVQALMSLVPGHDAGAKVAAISALVPLSEAEQHALAAILATPHEQEPRHAAPMLVSHTLAPDLALPAFLLFLSRHDQGEADPADPETRNGTGWIVQFLIEATGDLWSVDSMTAWPRLPGGKQIGPAIPLPSFAAHLVDHDVMMTPAQAYAVTLAYEGEGVAV